jgi:hypothetical protein
MKIENFDKVRELIKERDYLNQLYERITAGDNARLSIGSRITNDLYVKPEIIAKLAPEMAMILTQQITVVEEKLEALGVTAQ